MEKSRKWQRKILAPELSTRQKGRAFSNSKYLTLFSLALIASELKLTVLHLRKSTMMFWERNRGHELSKKERQRCGYVK